MKSFLSLILLLLFIHLSKNAFNQSICGYIQYDQLYYFINQAKSDSNIIIKSTQPQNQTIIYNLCQQLEYWCKQENNVISGSMIIKLEDGQCIAYEQSQIKMINAKNSSQGLKVVYKVKNPSELVNTTLQGKDLIQKSYQCNQNVTIGCPEVSETTLWTYFQRNNIGYTIAIQVIGVIFMILGVYMYRVTIIILGWATAFIVLVSIEQTIVFRPGVPQNVIGNVLILTIICGFFVGYVLAYFPKAGLFCMGMWIGLIISLTLNNVCLYLIYSNPNNLALYIMLPVLCIAFGILTMCVKRKFIIFATSLIGAYICLRALSWHLGAFPNEFLYPKQYQLGLIGDVKWQFYLYVIALLILTASSSALQLWLFKKKASKTKQSQDIDQHFNNIQNKMQNQRGNLMQFENIFKKLHNQTKNPRVLKRSQQDSQSDSNNSQHYYNRNKQSKQEQNNQEQEQDQQSQNSQQYQNRKKKQKRKQQLQQQLLSKGGNKKKR